MQEINKNKTLRILKAITPWAVFFVLLLFTLKVANAQYLGEGWDKYLEGVKSYAPNNKTGEELAENLSET